MYIYDIGSIVLKTFGKPLMVPLKRKDKTRKRMPSLTFKLHQEFKFTCSAQSFVLLIIQLTLFTKICNNSPPLDWNKIFFSAAL